MGHRFINLTGKPVTIRLFKESLRLSSELTVPTVQYSRVYEGLADGLPLWVGTVRAELPTIPSEVKPIVTEEFARAYRLAHPKSPVTVYTVCDHGLVEW